MPRLNGSRMTCAPRSAATPAVRSTDPSSTTTMSKPESNARSSSITRPTDASSLYAGTIASRFRSPRRASTAWSAGAAGAAGASSATDAHRRPDSDEVEDLTRAVRVGVLVEHALTRAPAHRLRRARIVEQVAVGGERLVRIRDDAKLRPGLEPPLDPGVGVRDDRSTCRRELERTARRGRVHRRVRPTGDVEVDARARDRLREHVERDVADETRVRGVAAEVAATEREDDVAVDARRLGDH